MKRFAANYVVSESGAFLKNGIVEADENGNFIRLINTGGDLRESALLSFHNGIVMTGFELVKVSEIVPATQDAFHVFIYSHISASARITMPNLIETGKLVQEHFPDRKIPEIIKEMAEVLLAGGAFKKEIIPGIFLLIGADLPELRFTSKSRIKKLL